MKNETINPQRLLHLRQQRGLTRAKLGERSRVNARTIQRIENGGQQHRAHATTLDRLAYALGVEKSELTDPAPPESPQPQSSEQEKKGRISISAGVPPWVRLAYDLVRRRYGVGPALIINSAPLLFTLHAEASLARRRAMLEKTNAALSMVTDVAFEAELAGLHSGAIVAEEVSSAEEESIKKADLFGEWLLDDYWERDVGFGEPFDETETNPFANYLRHQVDELDNTGVVDVERDAVGLLYSGSGGQRLPDYEICRDELESLTGGSQSAKLALRFGDVRLADIPAELMEDERTEERVAWLEARDPLRDLRIDLDDDNPDGATKLASALVTLQQAAGEDERREQ